MPLPSGLRLCAFLSPEEDEEDEEEDEDEEDEEDEEDGSTRTGETGRVLTSGPRTASLDLDLDRERLPAPLGPRGRLAAAPSRSTDERRADEELARTDGPRPSLDLDLERLPLVSAEGG